MKYILVLFVIFTTSCTKDGLITVPIIVNSSVLVDIPSGVNTSLIMPFTISAADNDQVEKYKDLIKSYEVKSISYQVVNYEGANDNKVTGILSLGTYSGAITNYVLSSSETRTLELSADQLKSLSDDFLSGNVVSGNMNAIISSTPAKFTVNFVVNASLKVL